VLVSSVETLSGISVFDTLAQQRSENIESHTFLISHCDYIYPNTLTYASGPPWQSFKKQVSSSQAARRTQHQQFYKNADHAFRLFVLFPSQKY